MKKVKIMLAAIAVVAVVGGTLAFKARVSSICHYKINAAKECPRVNFLLTATDIGAGEETILATPCPAATDPEICTRKFNFELD